MVKVIEQLQKKIQQEGLSVLQISSKTKIPAYRIYKWLAGKAKPKYEDVQTLEKYLSDCEEEVPIKEPEKEPAIESLFIELVKQQNRLLEMQNKILEEQKETMLKTVTDTNKIVSRLIHGLQATKTALDAASHVALKSLARIEKKPVETLLKEVADKILGGHPDLKKKHGKNLLTDN